MTKNQMKSKCRSKWIALTACVLLLGGLMTGCMNTSSSVVPDTANSTPPQGTMQPSDWSGGMNNGGSLNGTDAANVPPAFDWLNMGRGIEDRIGMISEIESCRIVVLDGTALAGVKFTAQYQGELTQRIRDMVAGEIMAADANIRTAAVTAQAEDVQKINRMADQIAAGTPAENFRSEIESILRNATTLQ